MNYIVYTKIKQYICVTFKQQLKQIIMNQYAAFFYIGIFILFLAIVSFLLKFAINSAKKNKQYDKGIEKEFNESTNNEHENN